MLDEAAARRRLSSRTPSSPSPGATGSGKSTALQHPRRAWPFRRPACAGRPPPRPSRAAGRDGAAPACSTGSAIPGRLRRRPLQSPEAEAQLRGLVLVDLPDHDSAAVAHREQVDRILALVDAVIWVVDPEKYADAVLHERYLRPLAGHAEVTFVVLNQVDRLPGDAADQVLDDLRRLLDEDGIALGEHGEPGATVLALSALTGDGVGELRESLGQFVPERGAAARRIAADVDAAARAAAARLRDRAADRAQRGGARGVRRPARGRGGRRPRRARRPSGPGAATPTGRAAPPGCGCGAGTRTGARLPTGRLPVARPGGRGGHRAPARGAGGTDASRTGRRTGCRRPWAQAVREAAVRGAQGLPGGAGRAGGAGGVAAGAAAAARLVAGRRCWRRPR